MQSSKYRPLTVLYTEVEKREQIQRWDMEVT